MLPLKLVINNWLGGQIIWVRIMKWQVLKITSLNTLRDPRQKGKIFVKEDILISYNNEAKNPHF